jgi:hypothetical protein
MLHGDRPIDRPRNDLLGRAGFALSLARAIDASTVGEEGFVIAVQGEWGSGKTSLIQMICRYLRHVEMERVSHRAIAWDVVPHPRSLAELDDMAEIYEQVEPVISQLDKIYKYKGALRAEHDARWETIRSNVSTDEDADRADYYWRLLEEIEKSPRTIVVRFSPWLVPERVQMASALLSDLARALGVALGDEVRAAFGAVLKRVTEFMPIVGAALDIASHGLGAGLLTRAGRDWGKTIAERMTTGQTLDGTFY